MSIYFLILNFTLFIVNYLYYIYKKRGYSLFCIKYLILGIFIISIIFLIYKIPFFILVDSNYIFENFENNIIDISILNISVLFFGISTVIFLLNFVIIDDNNIILDIPSYHNSKMGSIKVGNAIKGNSKKYSFLLSLKDLEKHMFICGSTGTGKSNFLQNFLINLTKHHTIPFFLVEFKGEYHFLQDRIKDILIIWPGENFSLNIFNPGESSAMIHAERIFNILKSGQFIDDSSEYSPQMEKVLIEILNKVCRDKKLQNWIGFEKCCQEYLKKNQNTIPMLRQTLISVQNRIRRFSEGPLKVLFESDKELSILELFKRNVILDLSSIIRLGGEKEDALFFLNMVLKYLWDNNLTRGAFKYNGIKHLTIIEDAQYFAPQGLAKKSKLTTYLEDIALLQRGTGECLITLATRPDISREILANNGIVLTFKNHIEKDLMCELLNLDLENKNYLSILEEGQCIIRVNSIKEPFLLWVPHIKRQSFTVSEIERKNKEVLEKFQSDTPIEIIRKRNKLYKFYLFLARIRQTIIRIIRVFFKNKEKDFEIEILDNKINLNEEINENDKILNNKEKSTFRIFKEYIDNLYRSQMNKK